jgi:hypothetical protein
MIFFLVVCFIIYVLDLNFYLSLSCLLILEIQADFFLCTNTQTRVIRTKTPATDKPATRLNRALKWVEVGQYISPVAWVGLTFWA